MTTLRQVDPYLAPAFREDPAYYREEPPFCEQCCGHRSECAFCGFEGDGACDDVPYPADEEAAA
jgi:hypothetical protein